MKRLTWLVAVVAIGILAVHGCGAMGELSKRVTGSGETQGLITQVPPENLKGVEKAEFELALARETVKLVELKNKWAVAAEKYAGYDKELADKRLEEAGYAVELAKAEAIDKSDLGKKEDNIKAIADRRVKKLNAEADRVQIEAKMATTKREMDFLQQQVTDQEKRIQEMRAAGPQAMKPATPPVAGPKPKEEGAPSQGQEKQPEPSKPAASQ